MLVDISRPTPIAAREVPLVDVKKLMLVLLIAFFGFWLFQDPNGLADSTSTAASSLGSVASQVFSALIDFIGSF